MWHVKLSFLTNCTCGGIIRVGTIRQDPNRKVLFISTCFHLIRRKINIMQINFTWLGDKREKEIQYHTFLIMNINHQSKLEPSCYKRNINSCTAYSDDNFLQRKSPSFPQNIHHADVCLRLWNPLSDFDDSLILEAYVMWMFFFKKLSLLQCSNCQLLIKSKGQQP